MTQNETSVASKRPAAKKATSSSGNGTTRQAEKAQSIKPKGYITNDWDFILEKKVAPKKLESIVNELLDLVKGYQFKDDYSTAAFEYQLFKSTNVDLLYSLRIFRKVKAQKGKELKIARSTPVSADHVPTNSPGSPAPKPSESTPQTEQVPSNPVGSPAPAPSSLNDNAPNATLQQVPTASPGPRAPAPRAIAGVVQVIER